ncbi:MAG: 2Fe-2S iron-sulfur cluster binding domain-containing protein [Clostridiales bacterium]|nr:2Fe-2S iron-sulfur cluster binding domain-containing protein [Clostridiales bacterium]
METVFHNVTVAETGERFLCGEGESVLAAMFRAGRGPITYGCCGGGCGACRMKIVSGNYVPFKKMSRAHVSERDIQDGIVLLCCVQPRGDLTIRAV